MSAGELTGNGFENCYFSELSAQKMFFNVLEFYFQLFE